ncbi:hypothetical protein E4U61_005272 [Claviceps capensis]|nr:hypothetical protein E4U61_005272 [Claviceps capensis]
MSFAAIASLRPLRSTCSRHATTSRLLSVRVQSASTTLTFRAVVSLPQTHQRRCQSQSCTPRNGTQPSRKQGQPQISFRQVAGRTLGATLRNIVVALSPRGIRSACRDAPVQTSLNIFLLVLLAAVSYFAIRSFVPAFYNSELSRFPEPVANSLRKALYYSNYYPDPKLALKFYKQAMRQATEVGLDPFSDEFLGIRIQVAAWLEKVNNYQSSIDVLESVLRDCNKWIATMDKSVSEGKVTEAGLLKPEFSIVPSESKAATQSTDASEIAQGAAQAKSEKEPNVVVETLWRKRQRLLAKAVATAVKLGELYATDYVQEDEKSHEYLVWAVEQSLKEFSRRASEGAKPGEQAWLSAIELGAIMESLGRDYERRSQFQLAVPLFFQALKVCDSPCHRAVIMNNLSACFAQQQQEQQKKPTVTPDASEAELSKAIRAVLSVPGQPAAAVPQTRSECLDAALNWAQQAHRHSQDVKSEARTEECDEACAVALCNWADVAAMLGKKDLARQKYEQCIAMSDKMGFSSGAEHARDGLANLSPPSQYKK